MNKRMKEVRNREKEGHFDNFADLKVFLNSDENARKELTGSKGKIFKRKEKNENANENSQG